MWLINAAAVTGLMVAFTTLPGNTAFVSGASKLLGGTELTDAIGHTVLAILVTGSWYGAARRFIAPASALRIAISIGLALGTATELLQISIPERGASVFDLLANWSGVLSVAILYRYYPALQALAVRVMKRLACYGTESG